MIDGQANGDELFADALFADLTEQAIGAEVESATALADRHHVGAEAVAPLGLGEEAGFAPDDIGPKRTLSRIVGQFQTGRLQEAPEHGFIPEQGSASMAGTLAGMRLLTLLQGDTKVDARGEEPSSIVFGAIAAVSPSVFELDDDAGEFDQPEAENAGVAFTS